MKHLSIFIVCCIIASIFSSCDLDMESEGPGYRFSLFKDTPLWELAKAVRDEDTVEIIRLIQEKHQDVNYRLSPHWGTTLLLLAVGNGKLLSTIALLNNGARLDIADNSGKYPIHYIVDKGYPHRHRFEILELLLKHGADPNAPVIVHFNGDTTGYIWRVPLMDATSDLECTKLLLQYGGNMNLRLYSTYDKQYDYDVWKSALPLPYALPKDENVFVIKYLVIDKKMPVPDTLFFYSDKEGMLARRFIDLLNESRSATPEQQKAKEEILAYLKEEGYPKHGSLRFW